MLIKLIKYSALTFVSSQFRFELFYLLLQSPIHLWKDGGTKMKVLVIVVYTYNTSVEGW